MDEIDDFLYNNAGSVSVEKEAETLSPTLKEKKKVTTDGEEEFTLNAGIEAAEPEGEEEEEEDDDEEDDEEDEIEVVLDQVPAVSVKTPTHVSIIKGGEASPSTSTSLNAVGASNAAAATTDSATGANLSSIANASNSGASKLELFEMAKYNGRDLIDVDLDAEFADKPWRKPGADITDYFNYNFNEHTWRLYCHKQRALRDEFSNLYNPQMTQQAAAMHHQHHPYGAPNVNRYPQPGPPGQSRQSISHYQTQQHQVPPPQHHLQPTSPNDRSGREGAVVSPSSSSRERDRDRDNRGRGESRYNHRDRYNEGGGGRNSRNSNNRSPSISSVGSGGRRKRSRERERERDDEPPASSNHHSSHSQSNNQSGNADSAASAPRRRRY